MSIEDLSLDRVTVGIAIESTTLTPEHISQRIGIEWDEVRADWLIQEDTLAKSGTHVWRIFERRQGELKWCSRPSSVCVAAVVQRLTPVAETLRQGERNRRWEFFHSASAPSPYPLFASVSSWITNPPNLVHSIPIRWLICSGVKVVLSIAIPTVRGPG